MAVLSGWKFEIVGAAYLAARSSGAWERQIGGDGPAPTKFAVTS